MGKKSRTLSWRKLSGDGITGGEAHVNSGQRSRLENAPASWRCGVRLFALLAWAVSPAPAQEDAARAGFDADWEAAGDSEYADEPYWYKPGHPLHPADAATITTLPDFLAERVLTPSRELGSWTALTVDPEGRLIVAGQHEAGLFRITIPQGAEDGSEIRFEKLRGAAERMGWSHGLHYAFDSLYVTVAEENDQTATGLYRLRDADSDGQFEESQLLLALEGSGEHGPHNVITGPDGESLYMICGNGTPLPPAVQKKRPVATEGVDHLMPRGFGRSTHTVAGWVARFDPDGSDWELISAGLRNSFDLACNRAGDLFTFDSDMEWDLGAPWYRPARICHLVSGAEFGWRPDAGIWPEYYEDSVAPAANVGPASPTGLAFGYGARFPAKYQNALFVCDWTFATIHAVHLEPAGSGYRAEVEEFVGGRGLPLTDLVIGGDGALYFIVGGRRLGSALYRVRYTGEEDVSKVQSGPEPAAEEGELHALRRELERRHGGAPPGGVQQVWPYLDHRDRGIRFAARVALESYPVSSWRERVVEQGGAGTPVNALLALARQGGSEDQAQVLAKLVQLPWETSAGEVQLRILRIAELAFARGGEAVEALGLKVNHWLRPHFPSSDSTVNRELSRLLCFLGDPSVIDPVLELMEADLGDRPALGSGYFVRNPKYGIAVKDMIESAPRIERMHHAQMLLWIKDGWTREQRQRYFELIAEALAVSKGGHQYREFWERIRELALDRLSQAEREEFESIGAEMATPLAEGLPVPEGPGREWTLEDALELSEDGFRGADLVNGRKMYAAAGCIVCHRFRGEGGSSGPDLSTIGQRFTIRDLLEATIHPSRAISDQYRVVLLETGDGRSFSGRMLSRDENAIRLATDLMRPGKSLEIANAEIRRVTPVPVSTMPSGLVNALNHRELRNLFAYLIRSEEVEEDREP
ncbi:MAG TPA: c-type cytochrome [Verrucomicrobiales bacterium]|nr:c-type cytochrome [Verrucomicrobiales bacterium]